MQAKFKEYQTPDEVKGITQIQRELKETKDVLHKTIESVLERGEISVCYALANDTDPTQERSSKRLLPSLMA